jgi:hypothetical protein
VNGTLRCHYKNYYKTTSSVTFCTKILAAVKVAAFIGTEKRVVTFAFRQASSEFIHGLGVCKDELQVCCSHFRVRGIALTVNDLLFEVLPLTVTVTGNGQGKILLPLAVGVFTFISVSVN